MMSQAFKTGVKCRKEPSMFGRIKKACKFAPQFLGTKGI